MAAKRRRFVQRRKSLGFTQESLAATLEVDRTTVERWENGRREPQPWIRVRLAATLQVSAEQLDQLLNEVDSAGKRRPGHGGLGGNPASRRPRGDCED